MALVAVLASCQLPTDESIGAFVTVSADAPLVVRGRQIALTAHLWLRHGVRDSVEVPNVALRWASTDLHKASLVTGSQHGRAVATGVNPGIDTIVVSAPAFQGASAGKFVLRVSDALAVDSIRPLSARYGDQITIYGVGIAHLVFAQLSGVTLLPDTFSTAGDSVGLSHRSFWVPFPADSGQVLAIGDGEFRTSPQAVAVAPHDRYDPNATAPAVLDLGTSPPFPTLPDVRFYNPALAFENLPVTGVDWFAFQVPDSTTPYTFLLTAPGLDGTDSVYVGDQGRSGVGQWSLGAGFADCKGNAFRPPTAPYGGVIAPMKHSHGSSTNLVAAFTSAGGYSLTAARGYLVFDDSVPPDRFESSSDCLFADENFLDPAKHIDLGRGFADQLTIDHPFEVDWLRVHVPGAASVPVVVSIDGRPPSRTYASSQLDLYLFAVPTGGTGLTAIAQSTGPGSTKSVTATVTPGDYYVVVVNADGGITPYAICAGVGSTCALPHAASRRIAPPADLSTIRWDGLPLTRSAFEAAGVRRRGTPAAARRRS